MRCCKLHFTDLSSNVGVCASCLRERLCPLVNAQTLHQQNHNSDPDPVPVFPRSVSPYINRRKTNNSASSINFQHNNNNNNNNNNHILPDRRFFSTPQIAPTTRSNNNNSCQKKKHRFINFSLLLNLFRSKKGKDDSNPKSSVCHDSATSATSSPFRFSNIKSSGGCRNKQPVCSDRGMSPVRYSDCDGTEDELYETTELRKPTPRTTPVHPAVRRVGGGGGGYGKNVSGISFCLSPLVRVSPCRNRNQKGVVPVDYGEMIGAPVKGYRCRSRKVADFGRIAINR